MIQPWVYIVLGIILAFTLIPILLGFVARIVTRIWFDEKLQFLKRQLAEGRLVDTSTYKDKGVN